MEYPDRQQLESLPTADLVRHALEESKLLIRAEILHAKQELRDELRRAKLAGVLVGSATVLALSGLALLFAALGVVLPLSVAGGLLLVGLVLLGIGAGLGFVGYRRAPKSPLPRTQERIKKDLAVTREQFA